MILLTNGCSWTAGGGLNLDRADQDEERLKLCWPEHLGRLMNAEQTVNLSAGCGSNQRIFRTTFDWVSKNHDADKIVAVIQWSQTSRYEIYNTKHPDKDLSNLQENWAKIKEGCFLGLHDESDHIIQWLESRFYFYTAIEGLYSMARDCSALAHIFNKHNIEFYYWTPFRITDKPNPIDDYILKTFKFMDYDTRWLYDRVGPHDLHPSILGHQQIAELIYSEIKSLKDPQ